MLFCLFVFIKILKGKLDVVWQIVLTSGPGGPYGPAICVPCRNVVKVHFFLMCLAEL